MTTIETELKRLRDLQRHYSALRSQYHKEGKYKLRNEMKQEEEEVENQWSKLYQSKEAIRERNAQEQTWQARKKIIEGITNELKYYDDEQLKTIYAGLLTGSFEVIIDTRETEEKA